MVWNADGLIITNAHVIARRQMTAVLADGRTRPARVVAHSAPLDLAALTLDAQELEPIEINPAMPQVGELLMAMGNPLGAIRVATVGMVHTVSPIPRWIQADIQLAPGNSGGPLATLDGRVVGINTQIAGGRALAIPIGLVSRFLSSQDEQPYLGISLEAIPVVADGALETRWVITQVVPQSPAAVGGILPGDQVVRINRQQIQTPDQLQAVLDTLVPDQLLMLEVMQRGTPSVCTVRVGRRASSRAAA